MNFYLVIVLIFKGCSGTKEPEPAEDLVTPPVIQEEPEVVVEPDKIATLAAVGDIMMYDTQLADATRADNTYDFSDCYYIAPTCTDNGRMTGPCRNCGEMFDEPVPATGHTYSDLVDTGDICNNVPTSFIYCTTCDVVIFSIGHNYKVSVTQATCTEDGKTDYTCIRCEDTYTVTREAVGHIGGEWTTVTEATCTAEGEEICRCMICDEFVESRTIECKEHTYKSTVLSTKIRYTCSVCGDVKNIDKDNEKCYNKSKNLQIGTDSYI